MNKNILQVVCVGLLFLVTSCTGSKSTQSDRVPPADAVGSVGGEFVTYDELRDNFVAGSITQESTEDDLVEFLPIYLDYRAKILDAKQAGYYENESIESEFQLYAKQASYAYWMDQVIKPLKFQEFKSRYDQEIKSRHILISLPPAPSPSDTAAAYERILEAREKLINGEDYSEVDAQFSTKRNGRTMGGELPWLTVGTTVAPFENVLFELEIGEISAPVRTQFGYHIIELLDKRERQPDRRVYHVYVRPNSNPSKIEDAYKALQMGGQWEDVVREFSEDTPSVQNEGYIGWINNGSRYNPDFVDTLMNLDPNEPFTKPITTNYGQHIFKVDSVRTFKTEEARDEYLMDILKESDAFQESNSFALEFLKTRFNAKDNKDAYTDFKAYINQIDSTLYSELSVPAELGSTQVFTFLEDSFTVADYVDYLNNTRANESTPFYSDNWFNRFKDAKIDERLVEITIEQFPEFKPQVNSYKEGLVVYQINEDSVWSTATIDTAILMDRYLNNLENYRYEKRFHYYMITSSRDTTLDRAIAFVEAGNHPDSLHANEFKVGVTADSTGAFRGEPFTLLDEMEEGTISERFEYGNRKAHFYLVEVLPARTMTFDEAFHRLASEYQPIREENWLNRLRKTYNIEAYPMKVRELYQQKE
ncbi:MAG: peptidylprolyl isomerase [Balneolaceae bacterium]|nr:peptidylprolyl isomerase [Balneolaceae bacterium]